jgi:hypothetical protein
MSNGKSLRNHIVKESKAIPSSLVTLFKDRCLAFHTFQQAANVLLVG